MHTVLIDFFVFKGVPNRPGLSDLKRIVGGIVADKLERIKSRMERGQDGYQFESPRRYFILTLGLKKHASFLHSCYILPAACCK